ncbi:pyroglutamylated RFamide peptide receptor-like [Stylophora pistillata]|uniref:pyroglutamylated RFamide peptide receptor-like n=1 Tax=Stylophora pistillata TaxID=50429 RepID=UPI000C04ADE2|nr:pyroglutamylated RFamide peptide receptor-like [Stylophora pistillata]
MICLLICRYKFFIKRRPFRFLRHFYQYRTDVLQIITQQVNYKKINYLKLSTMSESSSAALTTISFIVVVANVVGNSLVCWIIKKNRNMRTSLNFLLVNLAVADILFAVFITPKVLVKLTLSHPDGLTGIFLCKFVTGGGFAWMGGASSIVTLVSIAVERYYAVMHLFSSKGKLTRRRLKVIIATSWIFSLILNLPVFLVRSFDDKSQQCFLKYPETWMTKAREMAWLVLTIFPLRLMIGLYSRVVYLLWFKNTRGASQLSSKQKGVLRVRKRVTLTVIAVSVIFAICWGTSSVIYFMIYVTSCDFGHAGAIVITVADMMILFNSAVNPFVYALLNHQFREKIRRMTCCSRSSPSRIHPISNPPSKEFADDSAAHLSQIGGLGQSASLHVLYSVTC